MPPVRRRLFTLCSALSLLLCAVLAVAWPVSYRRALYVQRTAGGGDWSSVSLAGGRLGVAAGDDGSAIEPTGWNVGAQPLPPGPAGWRYGDTFAQSVPPGRSWSRFGIDFLSYADAGRGAGGGGVGRVAPRRRGYWQVMIPCSYLTLAAALPPAVWLRPRRRPHKPGRCPACGYDLRASPDRCPECRTRAAPAGAHWRGRQHAR